MGKRRNKMIDVLVEWAKLNIAAGCTLESIRAAALHVGHAEELVNQVMAKATGLTITIVEPQAATTNAKVPWPTTTGTVIECGDKTVNVLMSTDMPKCMLVESFLSDKECQELIELATPKLDRSTTVDAATGASVVHTARTSDGMFFQRGENALVKTIEERISVAFNWPVDHGEGLQILRYAPGKEYTPHNDYFSKSDASSAQHTARGGQRVGTFLLYLKTPEEGGETVMNDVGIKISPRQGNGFLFVYPSADAMSKTLHSSVPVVKGEKYVATKWLRMNVFT